MKDLKRVIKRDWKLYIAELLICIIATLVLIVDEMQAQISHGNDFHWDISVFWYVGIFGIVVLELLIPAMVICTFIYWWIFDDKRQKLFKASLPISNWQESKYDLISGYFICIVATISVLLSGVIEGIMWCSVYGIYYGSTGDMILDLLLEPLRLMMASMCVYTLMVVGKRVASSIPGALLFCIVFGGALIYLEQFIEYDVIGGMLLHGHFSEDSIPYNLGVIVGYLVLLVLLLIALVVTNKKIDIAKGGTFYFKSVQISICVLVTLFVIMVSEIDDLMRYSVVYGICVIALALMAGGGIYYITRAKK